MQQDHSRGRTEIGFSIQETPEATLHGRTAKAGCCILPKYHSDGLQTKGGFQRAVEKDCSRRSTKVWGEGGFPYYMLWTPLPGFPYFVNNPQNVISSWKNKGFIA